MEIKKSSGKIYSGKIFVLFLDEVILQNGNTATREYVVHPGAGAVLAIDEDDNCYLVKQFRYPHAEYFLEIPAGRRDTSETHEECVIRELREETGLIAKELTKMCETIPSVAYSTEVIHIFLAKNLTKAGQHLDEDEFLSVVCMPVRDALKKVYSGEIRDFKTQLALLFYQSKMLTDTSTPL